MTRRYAGDAHGSGFVNVLDLAMNAFIYGDGGCLAGRVVGRTRGRHVSGLRSNNEEMSMISSHQGGKKSLDSPYETYRVDSKGPCEWFLG